MTEDQIPGTGSDEVERHDYAALVDSLADTLDVRGGLAEAVDVAHYTTMSSHIASLLNLEAGLQSALAAAPTHPSPPRRRTPVATTRNLDTADTVNKGLGPVLESDGEPAVTTHVDHGAFTRHWADAIVGTRIVVNSTLEFRGAVHQNLYLDEGGREVHAVITVDAEGDLAVTANAPSPEAAEVLILDCSSSMGFPPEKIVKAKQAAGVAIDELRDGVWFALVAGSFGARMLWPAQPKLVRADAQTRGEAKEALRRLSADGGTTIGAWLRLAGQLFREHQGAIRHAILLTDGRNQHESPDELAAVLRDCEELFTCDCRGVGTDWSVAELRTISSALHGTVDLVVDPAGLAEDFRATMANSMRKAVGDVRLRLWTPVGATVRLVKQTAPTLVDLSVHRIDSGPQTGDYPTGSWGTESRDYHLCVELEPGEVGEEKLACRATFVHTGADGTEQPLRQTFSHAEPDGISNEFTSGRIRALWTDDLAWVTTINDRVAVVTGRAELAKAVKDGLAAHHGGYPDLAVDCLSRARTLAEQVHDDNLLARLDQIYDPDTGTFRLNRMSAVRDMSLDIESTKTPLLGRG